MKSFKIKFLAFMRKVKAEKEEKANT